MFTMQSAENAMGYEPLLHLVDRGFDDGPGKLDREAAFFW